MAKASDKQLRYLETLNEQAADEDKIDNWDIIKAANDKHNGTKLISAMIDTLKASAAPVEKVTNYTQQEAYGHEKAHLNRGYDASLVAGRNGPGRYELDNNTY